MCIANCATPRGVFVLRNHTSLLRKAIDARHEPRRCHLADVVTPSSARKRRYAGTCGIVHQAARSAPTRRRAQPQSWPSSARTDAGVRLKRTFGPSLSQADGPESQVDGRGTGRARYRRPTPPELARHGDAGRRLMPPPSAHSTACSWPSSPRRARGVLGAVVFRAALRPNDLTTFSDLRWIDPWHVLEWPAIRSPQPPPSATPRRR